VHTSCDNYRVEEAHLALHPVEGTPHLVSLRDIHAKGLGFAAPLRLAHPKLCSVSVDDQQLIATSDKQIHCHAADAAGSSNDQYILS
jgi:hypothetical protein